MKILQYLLIYDLPLRTSETPSRRRTGEGQPPVAYASANSACGVAVRQSGVDLRDCAVVRWGLLYESTAGVCMLTGTMSGSESEKKKRRRKRRRCSCEDEAGIQNLSLVDTV